MASGKKKDEPIQYVPAEENKTVIEFPPREEPRQGKEGGNPKRVGARRLPECIQSKLR